MHHPEALDLLRTAGCDVVEPDLVRVPRELVERARATALAVIEVFDRDGEPAMSLGSCTSCFGNGSAVTSVYDLETREHRPTRLDDSVMAARLCDALPYIDFVMAYAHPGEVDPHRSLLESFRAMVANTTKPLAAVADNAADLEVMWKIACELRGGAEELRAKPYFTVYGETTSALRCATRARRWPSSYCARTTGCRAWTPRRLPLLHAPITVAGHIAQGTAESLLGLVVHQLRQPGAPFIFGIGPAVLDMATSQSSYNAPECLMGHVCAVEMARWLDLPSWGYAGTTDAQVIDAQAGMEAAELTFLSMAIGSNLNHDLGYLDYGMTGSLELIVIMDEYISLNRRIFAGVEVNPETLAGTPSARWGPAATSSGPSTRRGTSALASGGPRSSTAWAAPAGRRVAASTCARKPVAGPSGCSRPTSPSRSMSSWQRASTRW